MLETIRKEVDDFLYNETNIVEDYSFSQYDTIKKIHLYMNDKFYSQPDDEEDRIFFNIVKYRREAIARFLDIDTKDIKLMALNPKSYWGTHFLEQELKYWLKKNKFGMLLNEMATELATFGSCVLRKTKTGADIVDLRRLFIDPSVKDILDSRFITIKHYLTPSELIEKKKDGWDSDAIDRILERVEEKQTNSQESYEDGDYQNGVSSVPIIEVYERFGELSQEECKEYGIKTNNPFEKTLTIVAEPYDIKFSTDSKTGTTHKEEMGEILLAKKWVGEYPFRDVHYSKTAGRWLGIGVVEDLFQAQERMNEIENQKRLSMELSALHLFQTADDTIVQNVLTDLQTGDLIKSKSGINPLANEERNLAAFRDEHDTWNVLADRISFANDLVTGGDIPASTPATNAVIQNTNSISVFLFKRQNFALFLQEFFNELVLPQCLSDLSAEHILRYVGDTTTLPILDQVVINEDVAFEVLKRGRPLSLEEIEAIKMQSKERLGKTGSQRFLEIKEKFYDKLDFEFDINIANEQENVQLMTQNTFSLLQGMVQAPQLVEDPLFKTLFFDYAQKVGISPARLEAAMAQRQTTPQGGMIQEAYRPPLSEAINGLVQEAQQRTQQNV